MALRYSSLLVSVDCRQAAPGWFACGVAHGSRAAPNSLTRSSREADRGDKPCGSLAAVADERQRLINGGTECVLWFCIQSFHLLDREKSEPDREAAMNPRAAVSGISDRELPVSGHRFRFSVSLCRTSLFLLCGPVALRVGLW